MDSSQVFCFVFFRSLPRSFLRLNNLTKDRKDFPIQFSVLRQAIILDILDRNFAWCWARSIRPKIPVWISETFACRMERYFPPGRTDLFLYPLEHISHQELLDKMLKDRDEVAVLSAVSCLMWRSLTRKKNNPFNAHADKVCKNWLRVSPFCEKFAPIYRFLNAFSITTLLLVRWWVMSAPSGQIVIKNCYIEFLSCRNALLESSFTQSGWLHL